MSDDPIARRREIMTANALAKAQEAKAQLIVEHRDDGRRAVAATPGKNRFSSRLMQLNPSFGGLVYNAAARSMTPAQFRRFSANLSHYAGRVAAIRSDEEATDFVYGSRSALGGNVYAESIFLTDDEKVTAATNAQDPSHKLVMNIQAAQQRAYALTLAREVGPDANEGDGAARHPMVDPDDAHLRDDQFEVDREAEAFVDGFLTDLGNRDASYAKALPLENPHWSRDLSDLSDPRFFEVKADMEGNFDPGAPQSPRNPSPREIQLIKHLQQAAALPKHERDKLKQQAAARALAREIRQTREVMTKAQTEHNSQEQQLLQRLQADEFRRLTGLAMASAEANNHTQDGKRVRNSIAEQTQDTDEARRRAEAAALVSRQAEHIRSRRLAEIEAIFLGKTDRQSRALYEKMIDQLYDENRSRAAPPSMWYQQAIDKLEARIPGSRAYFPAVPEVDAEGKLRDLVAVQDGAHDEKEVLEAAARHLNDRAATAATPADRAELTRRAALNLEAAGEKAELVIDTAEAIGRQAEHAMSAAEAAHQSTIGGLPSPPAGGFATVKGGLAEMQRRGIRNWLVGFTYQGGAKGRRSPGPGGSNTPMVTVKAGDVVPGLNAGPKNIEGQPAYLKGLVANLAEAARLKGPAAQAGKGMRSASGYYIPGLGPSAGTGMVSVGRQPTLKDREHRVRLALGERSAGNDSRHIARMVASDLTVLREAGRVDDDQFRKVLARFGI